MGIIEILLVVLLFAWLLGAFVVPIGGSAIHVLLLVIVIIIVVRLSQGERL